MEGLTPAASEGASGGLFSSGQRSFVCVGGRVPFARGSGALFIQWKGSVRSGRFHLCGPSDGERVRGAPRRAPDTPGSRPTKSPLRGSLASISSLQVGRDTASCLSRPQARITRPILGPRPFGAAASGVQKRSRRFCPCGDDLARQFRLGDFDAGPNPPTFRFLCFTRRFLSL